MGNSIVLNFLHSWRPAGSTPDGSRAKSPSNVFLKAILTVDKIANTFRDYCNLMQNENSNLGSNAGVSSAQSIHLNRI
jgi:hypothetical protein